MTLTGSPAALVRSLKGAPLACLFILLLTQGALRAGELCQATGYSPNSITAALRLLAQLELVAKTPDGWRVPHGIRSALLEGAGEAENFANRGHLASVCESGALGGEDNYPASTKTSPPPAPMPPHFASLIGMPPAVSAVQPSTQTPDCPSMRDNEQPFLPATLLGNFTVNSQPTTGNHQPISRILDATPLLFGERLHGPPSRYPDERLLLAAIAEAYTRRASLRTPARVAYANLKRGVDPGAEFLADPLAYLPGEFLLAAGLASPPPVEAEPPGDDPADEESAPEDPVPAIHPSLNLPADASARRSAAQVWEIAVRALRCELPPSINRRYLEPCWLAAFDADSATFTVGVPAEQDRLWLEDRLAARLTHLLNGICDRSCRVRFVHR